MNKVFNTILPYEARAEYFVRILGNGVSRKIAFDIYWPLFLYSAYLQREKSAMFHSENAIVSEWL